MAGNGLHLEANFFLKLELTLIENPSLNSQNCSYSSPSAKIRQKVCAISEYWKST